MPSVQLLAFQQIIDVICRHALLHRAFQHCSGEKSPIEVLTFSWKRRDEIYDAEWLLYYRLVVLSLTNNDVTRIVDDLVASDRGANRQDNQITLTRKLVQYGSLDNPTGLVAIRFVTGLLDGALFRYVQRKLYITYLLVEY